MGRFLLIVLTMLEAPARAVELPPAMAAPVCVACRVDGGGMREMYSAEKWRALMSGEIVTSETREGGQGDQRMVEGSVIIRYPPGQVWTVVTDFESRPKYVAHTKEVHILRIEGARVWVAEHLKILLMNIRFAVICTLDPERGSVSWVLDQATEHDIAGTTGSWQLASLADGHETLAIYRAWIDSGKSVPGFLESFLLERTLPQLIAGVRDEVRRRFAP